MGAVNHSIGLVIWGKRNVVEIDYNNNFLNHVKLHVDLDNMVWQKNQLIFTTINGDLYKCKNINAIEGTLVGQSFRLG